MWAETWRELGPCIERRFDIPKAIESLRAKVPPAEGKENQRAQRPAGKAAAGKAAGRSTLGSLSAAPSLAQKSKREVPVQPKVDRSPAHVRELSVSAAEALQVFVPHAPVMRAFWGWGEVLEGPYTVGGGGQTVKRPRQPSTTPNTPTTGRH